MTTPTALDRGRTAYREHRFADAVAGLDEADREHAVAASDLEHLGIAAILLGRFEEGIDALTRAHEAYLDEDDVDAATRCAAWLGMELMGLGDRARGGGWFARAQRLVEQDPGGRPDHGFLFIPEALAAFYAGDGQRAAAAFERAAEFAHAFRDADLIALAGLGLGQSKIMLGEPDAGLAQLDEAMVAVTAGEVSPIPSGIVYCGMLQSCRLAFDVRRAREWTRALDHWCAERPDMVGFTGQCHAHRAALFLLHGAWDDALAAAEEAQERAARGDPQGLWGAWYQHGEVHRLRGEWAAAESSYEHAAASGYEPEPGLALLRLAQGNAVLARSLILGAVERLDPAERRGLLAAVVEIQLGVGDVTAARAAAERARCAEPIERDADAAGHRRAVGVGGAARRGRCPRCAHDVTARLGPMAGPGRPVRGGAVPGDRGARLPGARRRGIRGHGARRGTRGVRRTRRPPRARGGGGRVVRRTAWAGRRAVGS